jgi:membrane protein required for colicin V production
MGSNVFDIIVIVLLAWSAYRGFNKGIISSAASLVALLLGVWGAIRFSAITAGYLSGVINVNERIMNIIAFAVTFILIVIAVHFVARAVEGLANAVALGVINKIAGAAFGVLKIAFIISVVLVLVNAADKKGSLIDPQFKQKSLFYKSLSNFAPTIFERLNFEELKQKVDKTKDAIDV